MTKKTSDRKERLKHFAMVYGAISFGLAIFCGIIHPFGFIMVLLIQCLMFKTWWKLGSDDNEP